MLLLVPLALLIGFDDSPGSSADAPANSGFAAPVWNAFQSRHDEALLGPLTPNMTAADRFRRNMLTPDETVQVEELIRKLADDDYSTREKATAELRFWKAGAEVLFRRHLDDESVERMRRLERVLQRGLGRWSPGRAEAAVRQAKKSPEMRDILVEYLPFAEDPAVERELLSVLRWYASQDPAVMTKLREAKLDRAHAEILFDAKADDPSPTVQADAAARRFFAAVAEGNVARLGEITQLPFSLGNGIVLNTPKERDDFFGQAIANWRTHNRVASLVFLHVVRYEDYARMLRGDEVGIFRSIPAYEMRAVHVRLRRSAEQEETGAVLVRITPRETRVIGLGYDTPRPPTSK
ncbi:MAG TPA: hypothetical protein VHR72_11315 [Gemmataceae bacterium]|jgi:hypothetical protein|nr:hypothetical protein [Gemmataceae bacterium]